MTTVQPAGQQLLALAEAVRGPEWAQALGPALAAARNAGWEWPRTLLEAARLLVDEQAHPRDLVEACRDPVHPPSSGIWPPAAEWAQARAAMRGTAGERGEEGAA